MCEVRCSVRQERGDKSGVMRREPKQKAIAKLKDETMWQLQEQRGTSCSI